MTPLKSLLESFRTAAITEREKGTYFEELIRAYLLNEAVYRDLYSDVWTYSDWDQRKRIKLIIRKLRRRKEILMSKLRVQVNRFYGLPLSLVAVQEI